MAGVNRHISKEPLNSLVNIELKGGGKIPLLEQALECARGRAGMQIELKGVGVASAAADDITRAIASGFKQEQLLVSSFDQQELFNFKRLMPGVPLGLLVYGYPLNCLGLARELGVISVHVNCDFVTANRVSQLKAAGYKVYVYTVNDLEELKTLLEMGVDGVFSDFPDKMLAASLPAA
jgi:glycerophosphoryl diester phosphodiesterase